MPRQNYADLYNWGVKFSKLKLLLGVLITSLFISSCAEYEYRPQGDGIPYDTFRAELQNLKPLARSGIDFDTQARYAYLNYAWWGCWDDQEKFRKFELKNTNEESAKSTLSWEQVGYCLPQIDTIVNGYLQLKIYKDTEISFDSWDPIVLNITKNINPSSKKSIELGCKKIIATEQSAVLKWYRGGNIDTDLALKGCTYRFEDTFEAKIAQAKMAKKINEQVMRQAEIDAAAEAEAAEALEPVDTNSREYITGLTIGNNFSDFSDAGAIAEDVCATARDRRIVLSSRGGVGVDPRTASFLSSKEGFQGCIDGFKGVPQD
jgi:hypothetical protein